MSQTSLNLGHATPILSPVFLRIFFYSLLIFIGGHNILSAELLPPGHRPTAPGTHLLRGGTVFTRPGEKIENASILIRESRIAAVGAKLPIPAEARVWDMQGLTIYADRAD